MSGKGSSLLDFIIFIPVWFIAKFTQLAPRPFSRLLWYSFAKAFWILAKKRRDVVINNIKLVFPDMPEEKVADIGFQSVNNIIHGAEYSVQVGSLKKMNIDDNLKIEGIENLDRAYKKGKGVILPTLHSYNMEWVNAMIHMKGYRLSWVVRELDNSFIFNIQQNARKKIGLNIIAKEKAMRKMIDTLRKGDILSFTTDQKASLNGEWVKFLGQWSSTTKSPAVLHFRTGAPIVPILPFPLPDGTHRVQILPEIVYTPTEDKQKDIFAVTQIIADLQSEYLRKHPEVWMWLHRRWSMTPGEELLKVLLEREAEFLDAGLKPDVSVIR